MNRGLSTLQEKKDILQPIQNIFKYLIIVNIFNSTKLEPVIVYYIEDNMQIHLYCKNFAQSIKDLTRQVLLCSNSIREKWRSSPKAGATVPAAPNSCSLVPYAVHSQINIGCIGSWRWVPRHLIWQHVVHEGWYSLHLTRNCATVGIYAESNTMVIGGMSWWDEHREHHRHHPKRSVSIHMI